MTDIIKGKIIVEAIKEYKNRKEWTDIYVENNYPEAIEYMFANFDKYFGDISSSSGEGSTTPDDARIKKIQQGERTIEYEYGSSNKTESTKTGLNKRIESDMILSSLLGLPLIKVM